MDIKKLEEMIEPSAMKMAGENQARLDSIASATGAINNLLKIAQNLDYSKKLTGNIATQDLLSQISQAFPQNNLAIDNSIAGIVNSLAESNPLNPSLFESIKLNIAFMDSLEKIHLDLKPKTQFIMPEGISSARQLGDLSSVMSKATEAFEQYNQFGGLESFRAISRLNNFPFEDIVPIDYTDIFNIKGNNKDNIFKMDSEISGELSSAKSFDELSEETKDTLLFIAKNDYWKIIHYLGFYICLNVMLNNGFSSNESFTIHDLQGMMYLAYQEFGNGIIASVLASYIVQSDNSQ